MNVKIAFLNGDLEEKIYMEQPKKFIVLGEEKKMCNLVKSENYFEMVESCLVQFITNDK